MADHSRQISKLREAAFRGWIKELQDVEEDRYGNAIEQSQTSPADLDGPQSEHLRGEQLVSGATENLSDAHWRDIDTQQRQAIAAMNPAYAEPNSPAARTTFEHGDEQTGDLQTGDTDNGGFAAPPAAPAAAIVQAATQTQTRRPYARQPREQSYPAASDQFETDQSVADQSVADQSVADQSAPAEDAYAASPILRSKSIDEATQKLIKDLRVMKRTRFNAQERFEAKHKASVAAFTLAAVFEIGLSLVGTNFLTTLPKDVSNFINFSSQITAVFILGFGLVATLSNYQTQALYLQRCAMDWGNLSRELQIAQPVSQRLLQDYRRRYHEIEGRCPPNHAAQDWRRAQLNQNSKSKDWRAAKSDFFLDVYLIYALTGIGYVTFFSLGLWQSLS